VASGRGDTPIGDDTQRYDGGIQMNVFSSLLRRIMAVPATVWAMVVSLSLGFQWGLSYGIANHNTYLIHGLKMYLPKLFVNDWLVNQTTDYHPIFSLVSYILYIISPNGWGFAFGNVFVIALTSFFIFMLVEALVGRRIVLPVYLLLMALVSATQTWGVSGSYIFSSTLQPSSIGSLGFVVAFYFFIKERYLASGIVLAVGGLFHANFLVLAFPLFILTHFCLGRVGILVRLTKQLGPSVLALAPLLPLLFAAAASPNASEGRRIFQEIQAPQHYMPLSYIHGFRSFASWHLLGIMAGWNALSNREWRTLRALLGVHLLLIGVATLLTTVVYLPVISQLYFWRLVPFSMLLVLAMGCVGAVLRLERPEIRLGGIKWIAAVLLVAVSIYQAWNYHQGWYRELATLLLTAIALTVLFGARPFWFTDVSSVRRKQFIKWFAIVLCCIGVFDPFADFGKKSSLVTGLPPNEAALYEWIKRETNLNDVFLTPASLENFRLNARRAIVVDFKSTPVLADELVEWYRRLETVTGVLGFSKKPDADEGYRNMDDSRLRIIAEKYHIDYVLVQGASAPSRFKEYQQVYENSGFVLYHKLKNPGSSL
jgi:hypothetical protein